MIIKMIITKKKKRNMIDKISGEKFIIIETTFQEVNLIRWKIKLKKRRVTNNTYKQTIIKLKHNFYDSIILIVRVRNWNIILALQ